MNKQLFYLYNKRGITTLEYSLIISVLLPFILIATSFVERMFLFNFTNELLDQNLTTQIIGINEDEIKEKNIFENQIEALTEKITFDLTEKLFLNIDEFNLTSSYVKLNIDLQTGQYDNSYSIIASKKSGALNFKVDDLSKVIEFHTKSKLSNEASPFSQKYSNFNLINGENYYHTTVLLVSRLVIKKSNGLTNLLSLFGFSDFVCVEKIFPSRLTFKI